MQHRSLFVPRGRVLSSGIIARINSSQDNGRMKKDTKGMDGWINAVNVWSLKLEHASAVRAHIGDLP